MRLFICAMLAMVLAGCATNKPAPKPMLDGRPTAARTRAAIHDRMVMNEFAAYKAEFSNFPPDVSTNDRSTVYHFIDGTVTLWWKPNKLDRFATLENFQYIDRRQ